MEIFKIYQIEVAHFLPNVSQDHPCRHVHGHTIFIELHFSGPVDPKMGWIVDFAEIDKVFMPIKQHLDHKLLNEIEGLENPTSENIARWIWPKVNMYLPQLSKIIVKENPTSGCSCKGDHDE